MRRAVRGWGDVPRRAGPGILLERSLAGCGNGKSTVGAECDAANPCCATAACENPAEGFPANSPGSCGADSNVLPACKAKEFMNEADLLLPEISPGQNDGWTAMRTDPGGQCATVDKVRCADDAEYGPTSGLQVLPTFS